MYSAYKLNKQGDNIQPWHTPFPIWNQSVVPCSVLTVASWPAYRFLKRQVRWSGIPISFRIFQFIVSSPPNSPTLQEPDKQSLHSFRTSAETFYSGMLFPDLKITSLSSMHSSPTEIIQTIASLTCHSYPPWFFINDTHRLYPPGHWHHERQAAAAAKSLQSCPTLCDPIDSSLPGSAVPGILQARTLEWVAISFSNAWEWKVKVKSLSHVRVLEIPWAAAYQAPPSMGFSRQEYWSGVPVSRD